MILYALAFLAGVSVLQFSAELPDTTFFLGAAPAGALLLCKSLRLPALFVLGFLWAAWRAGLVLDAGLPVIHEGENLLAEGQVKTVPLRQSNHNIRFVFYLQRYKTGGEWHEFGQRVRLNWYGTQDIPVAGERWQFVVRLKRPHGFANPGGFDYERWLFQQGLRATGYIRKDARNRPLPGDRPIRFSGLRTSLVLTMREGRQDSPDMPGMALIRALTVGDRSGVTSDQWAVLRASGTSHLMAISGLHISLAAGLGFLLVRRLWSCSSRLTEKVAAGRAAAIAAIVCAMFYAYLAGFSIPTQRALIMVIVFMLATLSGSRSVLSNSLCLAVFAVLIIDPLSVLSAGWWLSFWAVTVIAFTVTGREGKQSHWWRWGRVHLVMAISMLPMLLSFFQLASLISPLANVLAVPFVGLLVVPVSLIGVCLLTVSESAGFMVLDLAAGMMEILWPLLDSLATSKIATWEQHQPPGWTLLPATGGILLLLAPGGIPARWLGLVLLIPLFTVKPAQPGQGEFWLTLLDVGQGLSTVIQTQHHTLVYDAGAKFSDSFNAGEAVLVPFLRHQGITQLDKFINSHSDNDHIGGAASLLRTWPPVEILSGMPDTAAERFAGIEGLPDPAQCHHGQGWVWDGVEFEVLYPQPGMSRKGNNASCVLVIRTVDGQAAMLTGDIEGSAEQQLLQQYPGKLPAEVLVAPHHGSKTSSSSGFVSAVLPDRVLFAAGYRNRYGFPKPDVVGRYRRLGSAVHVTGTQGAVSVKFVPGAELEIRTHREEYRRYWHTN